MQSPTSLNRLTIVGVALISALAIPMTYSTLWGIMAGVTFLLVLYAYGQASRGASTLERAAFAATQAICVALALSWFLHFFLFPSLTTWEIRLGGYSFHPGHPDALTFLLWLVVFVVGYVVGRRR